VRVPVTRVVHYASDKFEVSTTLRFRENRWHGRDRQTDGRGATLHHPDTSVLWPLDDAARMRARC